MRKTDDELRALLAGDPQPFQTFRHYKGGLYVVVARAVDEATHTPLVVYQSAETGITVARPLASFVEELWLDDFPGPIDRFRRETG